MKKRTIIILAGIIGILALMQLIPVDKPINKTENPADLIKNNLIPSNIAEMLKNACYDCHSNEVKFPWYSKIYPVKYIIYTDINEGRGQLNFSEWENYKKLDKATMLDKCSSETEAGEMPLKIYTWMHPEAKLTGEQKDALISWTEEFAESLFE